MLEPRTAPDGESSEWPLRGEILSHVDRLRTSLEAEAAAIPRVARAADHSTDHSTDHSADHSAAHCELKESRPRDMTPTR
jgi:hypothetical protein